MSKIKEALRKASSVASLYSVPASAAIVGWLAAVPLLSWLLDRFLSRPWCCVADLASTAGGYALSAGCAVLAYILARRYLD